MDYKNLSGYRTPVEPFEPKDRNDFPFLMGDVFNDSHGNEFTLFQIEDDIAYGVLTPFNAQRGYLKRFSYWQDLFKSGFKINQEFVEESIKLKNDGIVAPRKLQDGTWAGISRLMFTSAICVDYDIERYTMYESRYCFSHNSLLPSWYTAIYWLSQFKHKLSLPIGNCAYRGILGKDPIADPLLTKKYYEDMLYLKDNMNINGLDIFGVADAAMQHDVEICKNIKKTEASAA